MDGKRLADWIGPVVLSLAAWTAGLQGATDREVGSGKTYQKIADALAAAEPGDRVVVYSGTYDEQFVWAKQVDIVEAPGETAVLRPTDSLTGPFLLDIILGDGMEVTWDGIDLVYASTKFSRLFMNRVGAANATVTIQNISVTDDDALSGGTKGRVFSCETGTMEVIKCSITMDNPSGYEMIAGAMGGTLTLMDSTIAGSGDRTLYSEISSSVLNIINCTATRTQTVYTAFLSDFGGGTVNITDSVLTASSENTARGVLCRGAPTTLTMNRTIVDGQANWWPFALENGSTVSLTNVVVVKNPSRGGVQFAIWTNGNGMSLTLLNCTFSSTQDSSGNAAIIDESGGSPWSLTADGNLFYLPGTTFGAIRPNPAGGVTILNAGTNLRFVGNGDATSDLLQGGTILTDDPMLRSDLIHLQAGSPAIDALSVSDVDKDIDKETRPLGPAWDLGADEFSDITPPPPNPPTNLVATAIAGGIRLRWTAPVGGPVVTGYNVYRTQPSPQVKVNDLPLTDTTLTISGLNPENFCFIVYSVGEGVTPLESLNPSNEDCATPIAVPPPGAPRELAAVGGERQIQLTWKVPTSGGEVASYLVYRLKPGSVTVVATASKGDTSIVLPGIPAGMEFCFKLRARGVTGLEGPDSNSACATATPLSTSVDREVGFGKPYATIAEALAAAVDGDRVVVFTGTYNEQFGWGKLVDIVEASGETAVLQPTDSLSGPFLIDIGIPSAGYVTWQGIDLIYDSTKFVRLFLKRGPGSTNVIFKDFNVSDTDTAAGKPRVFGHETGSMIIQNVNVDLKAAVGYDHIVSVIGAGIDLAASDSKFEGPGERCVYTEGVGNTVTLERCTLNRRTSGFTAFLTDFTDGSIILNDCFLTGGSDTARGILCRFGGKPVQLELNRCTFDVTAPWWPVAFEKAVNATFTNCCFPKDPAIGGVQFSVIHNNATGGGGDTSSLTFRHCTFASTAESGGNAGIIDETFDGKRLEIEVQNCLFSIPGSLYGAIRKNNISDTTEVIAGKNLRYLGPGGAANLVQPDLLEQDPAGVLVEDDPKMAADFCHIEQGSPAIDVAPDIGVPDDIDGDTRPIGPGPDLGADEVLIVTGGRQTPFDANQDRGLDLSDVIWILGHMFLGENPTLPCDGGTSGIPGPGALKLIDANGDLAIDISDPTYVLAYLFLGGKPPVIGAMDECVPIEGCPDICQP